MGSSAGNPLDVLVVGGAATGCGVALDAATGGLRVGLVQREDFASGTSSRSTNVIHGDESVKLFPTLARNGNGRNLKGTVVYYDGQMNDSRLNVGLACTSALAGAAVLNYAGLFLDSVRTTADKDAKPIVCPSSGAHIFLPDYHSPEGMGLIVPKTKDGRVVFMLPWPGRTMQGGKWTTYRSMAEDAVKAAIKSGKLISANDCINHNLRIVGGEGWDLASFTVLAQQYARMKKSHGGKAVPGAMDSATAKHLA